MNVVGFLLLQAYARTYHLHESKVSDPMRLVENKETFSSKWSITFAPRPGGIMIQLTVVRLKECGFTFRQMQSSFAFEGYLISVVEKRGGVGRHE